MRGMPTSAAIGGWVCPKKAIEEENPDPRDPPARSGRRFAIASVELIYKSGSFEGVENVESQFKYLHLSMFTLFQAAGEGSPGEVAP